MKLELKAACEDACNFVTLTFDRPLETRINSDTLSCCALNFTMSTTNLFDGHKHNGPSTERDRALRGVRHHPQ